MSKHFHYYACYFFHGSGENRRTGCSFFKCKNVIGEGEITALINYESKRLTEKYKEEVNVGIISIIEISCDCLEKSKLNVKQ